VRVLIQHKSRYSYPRPASLGAHLVRLSPASHTKARIESYSLRIEPEGEVRWQRDPLGNHVARVTFRPDVRVSSFGVTVELAVDVRPVNPFDFFLDPGVEKLPFSYAEDTRRDLAPFLTLEDPALAGGEKLEKFLASLPREGTTVDTLVAINRAVKARVDYVIREETGIWTPEETLANGRGSCRDSAVLLVAAFRSQGLAARFVSGYLLQLRDEGMLPDEPRGVSQDVADLHAWAEVFLPGAGWIGLDATSGLMCGEGHIPLVSTASPSRAAPIEGTTDVPADGVTFEMRVARLGHEPRPTAPYTDELFTKLLSQGESVDAALRDAGIPLTLGGEPTFNSRIHPEAPEWNEAAVGPTKWAQGIELARELLRRRFPGGILLHRMGKHYPGESLPRWALDLYARRDGRPLFQEGGPKRASRPTAEEAHRFARTLAGRLGLGDHLHAAYEDPWRFLQEEAALPVDVDPLKANLKDSEDRRRLARVLDRGLGDIVGWVLPIAPRAVGFRSETWSFRRGHLFLLPGDSPVGLRLPLASLGAGLPLLPPVEEPFDPPDPRAGKPEEVEAQRRRDETLWATSRGGVRTALCVEERGGDLFVFLPPLRTTAEWIGLVEIIDGVRRDLGTDVVLEGYPPPRGPELSHMAVTPDPGVLEVNLPPTSSLAEYEELTRDVFDAALRSGLHSEKYMLDGRQAGSGGGNHITLGGPTPLTSPFVRRPDLLASLITFVQHHPSLSYLFTGLFIGPTSQAPRVDEARHESLYELEIALAHAFAVARTEHVPPPWLADQLFRHLMVDLTGNTHRAEISLDKLFDHQTPHGRQGLVELRAFEMPPHPRMLVAQAALVRAMVAALSRAPYEKPLVRWGMSLHDRFLLPHWLETDLKDVLDFLGSRGVPLDPEIYVPFLDLRCPVAGRMQAGDVVLEVRNALEPWHVLGEELTTTGTARYVDSSVERIQVRVENLVPERHVVMVNGHRLPVHPTGRAGEHVAGVRFRAWAPPHSLHAHLGIHHPLRLDVVDTWARRSLGGCGYHVWHPEGRAFDLPPLTRFEASARRAQRFTVDGPTPWPVEMVPAMTHGDAPYTLDLRRYRADRPMPDPLPEDEGG
jgi:uncharacterized protein (DUF2126 family)